MEINNKETVLIGMMLFTRRDTEIKKMRNYLLMIILSVSLSACLVPEKFTSRIKINKDGTYSLKYDGILTWVPLRVQEIKKGRLSNKNKKEIQKIESELKKNSYIKKVSYVGHASFQVLYERTGKLDAPVYFISSSLDYITLIKSKNNTVQIKGFELFKKDIRKLTRMNINVNGRLEVVTDAKVIKHNASSTPKLMGFLGSYVWQMGSINAPAPYMLIQLQ